jgi:hypothetical protein
MASDLDVILQEKVVRLPLHFDVQEHFLLGADYVVAVNSLITCLNELNKRAFDGKLICELRVLTNEEGSIKAVTGVFVKGIRGVKKTAQAMTVPLAMYGLIAGTETDTFRGLVHGLTGYEINHYATADKVGVLLHDMLVGIFTTETAQLEKAIPTEINLDKALKAKSEFYAMCMQNQRVDGVGFDDKEEFPIKRNRFIYHTSKDKIRPTESDFVLYDTIIISPVDVDKDIKWELQDKKTKSAIKAHMRDDAFKKSFLSGHYPLKASNADDQMKVLVEYQKQEKNGEIETKEVSIHTVYSFNNTEITPVPRSVKISQVDARPMDKMWGTK